MATAARTAVQAKNECIEVLYQEQRLLEAGINRYRLLGDTNMKLNCISKLEVVRQKIARIQNELKF